MSKPKEIVAIEKAYGITLEQKDEAEWSGRNCYALNSDGAVVALNLIGNKIQEIKGLENLETIFLMGLVHDIGKMLLLKVVTDMYPDVPVTDEGLQLAIHEIHTTFGGALLKKMNFSRQIIKIAEVHHWDQFEKNTDKELLVVSLADSLARELGFSFFSRKENGNAVELEEGDLALETEEEAEEFELDHDKVMQELSGLSSLKVLELDPEKVFSILEQTLPMIREISKAF